jgi:REP element-mobilizing transposase RayT
MELRVYRRHLPHWRVEGATYFVTWRLYRFQPPLEPEERDLVALVLRHFEGRRYTFHAYVVMYDHVHLVVTPMPGVDLEKILHSLKSYSARRLQREHGRSGAVWQNESHDRIIRNEGELDRTINYVRGNPRRRWPEIEGYRWVWCRAMPPT